MTLYKLKRNEKAKIIEFNLNEESKLKLGSLGMYQGVTIEFERRSPLGDPQLYYVSGNYIAIRKEDAKKIKIELI